MPMSKGKERKRSLYEAINKLHGEKAERLSRNEYFFAILEIKQKCRAHFRRVEEIMVLDDKTTFGDVDLIVINETPPAESDEDRMRQTFQNSLLEYKHQKNDRMDSLLLELSTGKTIQVDLMRTKDDLDFEAKLIHASKGHSSAVIGTLARAYGYKFGIDGFYKVHRPANGQHVDILITKDLYTAMKMLDIDPQKWISSTTVEDIITLVSESSFFNPQLFRPDNFRHKKRVAIRKRSVQDYMYQTLSKMEPKELSSSPNIFIEENFTEEYKRYQESVKKLSETSKNMQEIINGDHLISTLGIKPSPIFREILSYIKEKYPEAGQITTEMADELKRRFSL